MSENSGMSDKTGFADTANKSGKPAATGEADKQARAGDANQGEGNQTAARAYDKDTTEFAKSGKVEQAAQAAAKDAPDEQAEQIGRKHSHGEDPAVKR